HDLPASGCDPNPDRAAQEGYGLHFLHALRGEDRYGRPLGAEHIDFDGDGRISLLEAHTRVRIASAGGEVPVTTSERWLREVTADLDPDGPRAAFDLPEERAVITALGEATGLGANLDRVTFEIDVLETRMGDVRLLRDEAAAGEEAAFADVSGEMLSRWP